MALIDDEGNLFGVVNVIDALVVLLVLAVVAAGAALVLQPEPEQELATTNVTLDLGPQPTYIVSAINEGDSYAADQTSQLTLTDVYLTPQWSRTRVIVPRGGGGAR